MLNLVSDSQFPWRMLQQLLIVPVWLKESVGAEMPCWMGTPRIMTGILAIPVISWEVVRLWFNWHSHTWLGQYGKKILFIHYFQNWRHAQLIYWYSDDPSNFSKDTFLFFALNIKDRDGKSADKEIQGACLDFLVDRCSKIRLVEGLNYRPLPGMVHLLLKFQFVLVKDL